MRGYSHEIATANRVNIQIVESYLVFLVQWEHVHPGADGDVYFTLFDKGRRYLRERGLVVA